MMTPIRSSYSHMPLMAAGYAQDPYMVSQDPNRHYPYAQPENPIGRSSSSSVVLPIVRSQPPPRASPHISDEPPRRTRASKPKVKTGCITCKIRHVKCDEAKPACKRCTSTGRKCDGYDKPVPSAVAVRRPQIHLPAPMTQVFQGTVQERDAFHRFRNITIPVLNGGSEAKFWYGLVLQAGVQEPIIRQAIIALGTLHEEYTIRGGRHDNNLIQQPTYQRAIHLYTKALRQLNERLNNKQEDSTKIAVIASILFTCVEVLRRNDMTAIVHYRSGMKLLMDHMNKKQNKLPSLEGVASKRVLIKHIPQDELDILLRVFARYDVQACTFAKPSAEPLATSIPELPTDHVTLEDVRYHLDNLLVASYQLLSSPGGMYRYFELAKVPEEWRSHVEQQIVVFEKWQRSLETFFNAAEVKLSPADAKSLLGLRLQIRVAIIRLKTSYNAGPETTFDAYRRDFEEMVASVERVTQSLALTDADPLDRESTPFTMDLGIVHPLFFIAWKCRDRRLRKRAIAQLRKAGKEGVWDGPIMAVLAKRMMQIEETGLISGQTVPECNRIHRLQKSIDYDGRRIMVEMTRARDISLESWDSLREAIPF